MLNMRFEANDFDKNLEVLQGDLLAFKDDVAVPYYFQRLQGILARAGAVGRQQIADAVTATGIARARAGGGEPGRIESRAFIDNFKATVGRSNGKGRYEFEIGWLSGSPNWASYQELGFLHSSGMFVTGADALGAAERYILSEIEKLK